MKRRLKALWQGWVTLLDRRESGEAMALLRIFVGLVLIGTLLDVLCNGLLHIIWVDRAYGGYRSLGEGPFLVRWLGGPTPNVISALFYTSLISGVLLVIGLGGRVTPFIALQSFMALHRLNGHASGSGDLVIDNALWLLVLSRSTATLSLDCLLRTKKLRSDEEISAFPRYLAIVQLVIIYFTTGLQKLSAYWLPMGGFSAIYYILQQPTWQRIEMEWIAHFYPLTQLATLTTWLWETTSPVLLLIFYYRYTSDKKGRIRRAFNRFDLRLPWMGFGLVLHLIILVSMAVGPFTWITVSLYVCLWQPAELKSAGHWALQRIRRQQG